MVERGVSPRILVVGLGNPDRGDDGVGAMVVRDLVGRLPPDVTILARSADMLSLVSEWAGYDALVCVDAAMPMTTPGRIHRIDLRLEELRPGISTASTHWLGLVDAIELGRVLGLAPTDVIIYAVEGRCFDIGTPVAPEVVTAVAAAANCVAGEVARLQHKLSATSPSRP